MPSVGKRKSGLFSPCLEMRGNQSTLAEVVSVIEGDPFDHAEIVFRGKQLRATCAHPGILAGTMVNLFEHRPGVFFVTGIQESWFLRPIAELIKHGRPAQAAMEFLVKNNRKYWPALIAIDKRGQEVTELVYGCTDPDALNFNPLATADDGSCVYAPPPPDGEWPDGTSPIGGGVNGWHSFDDYDTDGDGYLSLEEFLEGGLGTETDFSEWDTNGDGKLSEDEFAKRGYQFELPGADTWLAYIDQDEVLVGTGMRVKSKNGSLFEFGTNPSALNEVDFPVDFNMFSPVAGTPVYTYLAAGPQTPGRRFSNSGGPPWISIVQGKTPSSGQFCRPYHLLFYIYGAVGSESDRPGHPHFTELVATLTAECEAASSVYASGYTLVLIVFGKVYMKPVVMETHTHTRDIGESYGYMVKQFQIASYFSVAIG